MDNREHQNAHGRPVSLGGRAFVLLLVAVCQFSNTRCQANTDIHHRSSCRNLDRSSWSPRGLNSFRQGLILCSPAPWLRRRFDILEGLDDWAFSRRGLGRFHRTCIVTLGQYFSQLAPQQLQLTQPSVDVVDLR